jgi:hypothetical protein
MCLVLHTAMHHHRLSGNDPFLYGQLVILRMLHGAVRTSFLKLCIFEQLGPQASGQQCRGHQVGTICAWIYSDPHTALDPSVAPCTKQAMHSVIRGSRFCEQDCVSSSIGALAMGPRSNRNNLPVSVTCACRSQVDVVVTVPNNLVLMSTANAIEKRS